MTRWLVTGAAGQLGSRLVSLLADQGDAVTGLTRGDLDVTDASAVATLVAEHDPEVIVNAAAYTDVDGAETHEAAAALVNATAPGVLAGVLADRGRGRLIHVSTDYVFDGQAASPYEVDDAVGPRTAYGRTKLAGERAVAAALGDRSCIVRTAWVYGGPGPNFVDTMVTLERTRDTIDVVDDQVGSPTFAGDLAAALIEVAQRPDVTGVQHFCNDGQASWFALARETFRLLGADPARVHPTDSATFVRPAPRPPWSVLSTRAWTAAGLTPPRPWPAALADALSRH